VWFDKLTTSEHNLQPAHLGRLSPRVWFDKLTMSGHNLQPAHPELVEGPCAGTLMATSDLEAGYGLRAALHAI